MNKQVVVENWDKAGGREWLQYYFWAPEAFADNHDISIRQLRNHMSANGMPFHGRPHRGVPGSGIRLGKAADKWLGYYRLETGDGRFRFSGLREDRAEDVEYAHIDDAQAYARLYSEPIPYDEYIATHAMERRSWAKKFKEIQKEKPHAKARQ